MEKTIEKHLKKPKTPKKTKLSDLTNQLLDYKKNIVKSSNRITKVDFKKGILTFLDIQGKEHSIDTSQEILIKVSNNIKRFEFGKPVLFISSYLQTIEEYEDYWNEDTEEYEDRYETYSYQVHNLYLFYQITSTYNPSSSNLDESTFSKKSFIEFENYLTGRNKNRGDYDGIATNAAPIFFENLKSKQELYENSHSKFSKHTKTLFIEGKKFKDVDIKKAPFKYPIYINNLLKSRNSTYLEKSFRNIDSCYDFVEENPYQFNDKEGALPVCVLDKSNKNKVVTLDNWLYNNTFSGPQDDKSTLNLNLVNLKIDFGQRKVNISRNVQLFKMGKHYDCCGANLPHHHSYSTPIWNTLPQQIFEKMYSLHLYYDKADKIVLLTEVQIKSAMELYEKIFSKEAITKLHEYTNMNSGNIIHVYHINCTLKLQNFLIENNSIFEGTDWSDWDNRNIITRTISEYLAPASGSQSNDKELSQWFENSELMLTKTKPIVKKRSRVISRSKRNASFAFDVLPINNYKIR